MPTAIKDRGKRTKKTKFFIGHCTHKCIYVIYQTDDLNCNPKPVKYIMQDYAKRTYIQVTISSSPTSSVAVMHWQRMVSMPTGTNKCLDYMIQPQTPISLLWHAKGENLTKPRSNFKNIIIFPL